MHGPDERCEYVADEESVPGSLGRWCCWRPVQNGSGYCCWHADETAKAVSALADDCTDYRERFDGAVVRSILATADDGDRAVSFAGCTLVGADCADACLSGLDFEDATLLNADLSGADLRGATLTGASLRNADLSGADLTGADLTGADLTDASITDATLSDADLPGATARYADFTGATLRSVDLEDATCSHASFANAELRNATGVGASFRRADLSEADLFDVAFADANCSRAVLSGVDLENASLQGANLESATLAGAVLFNADLSGAAMFNADLTGSNAQHATFEGADLEDVTLSRTELRDANLRGARLYQAVLADTRINSNTEFGERCIYETDPDADVRTITETVDRLLAAAWTYRRLERVHDENAMAAVARRYHIRKNEVQRAYDRRNRNVSRYAVSTANRYLTNHGESLKHVVYSSTGIILLAGVLYPFVGGISDGETVYRLSMSDLASGGASSTFARTLYFSVITFTTIGYGNVYPLGIGSRVLVGIQSLLGALLMALVVFVLGRRVAR